MRYELATKLIDFGKKDLGIEVLLAIVQKPREGDIFQGKAIYSLIQYGFIDRLVHMAMEPGTDDRYRFTIVDALIDNRKHQDANRILDSIIDNDNVDIFTKGLLADTLLRVGRENDANKFIDEMTKHNNLDDGEKSHIADVCLSLGRQDDAVRLLKGMVEYTLDDGIDVYRQAAAKKLGDLGQVDYLRSILSDNSRNIVIRARAGMGLLHFDGYIDPEILIHLLITLPVVTDDQKVIINKVRKSNLARKVIEAMSDVIRDEKRSRWDRENAVKSLQLLDADDEIQMLILDGRLDIETRLMAMKYLHDQDLLKEAYTDFLNVARDMEANIPVRIQAAQALLNSTFKVAAIDCLLSIAIEPAKGIRGVFEQKSAITALEGGWADDKLLNLLETPSVAHEIRTEICKVLAGGKFANRVLNYLEMNAKDASIEDRTRLEMIQLLGKISNQKLPDILFEIAKNNRAGSWTQEEAMDELIKLDNHKFINRIAVNRIVDSEIEAKALIHLFEGNRSRIAKWRLIQLAKNHKTNVRTRMLISNAFWENQEYKKSRDILKKIFTDSKIEARDKINIMEDAAKIVEKKTLVNVLLSISNDHRAEIEDRSIAVEK